MKLKINEEGQTLNNILDLDRDYVSKLQDKIHSFMDSSHSFKELLHKFNNLVDEENLDDNYVVAMYNFMMFSTQRRQELMESLNKSLNQHEL